MSVETTQPRPTGADARLSLFTGFGIELEYMIVNRGTLNVATAADLLLEAAAGHKTGDVERGAIAWSNELALHVVELKANGPAPSLAGLATGFQTNVDEMTRLLARYGLRLMPTAMHPWMDPHREAKLWPHEYTEVYRAFDRVFDCRGHGWSNLQSMHINLPFADDGEFGRLHAAVRMVLPLLPALAASSPVVDGRLTGLADNRLEAYRNNCRRIPSVTGRVIPEPVFTEGGYRSQILARMYADIAPFDPAGLLQDEYLNARGAIARFDRGAIEIRVLDVQECPAADLAVAALTVGVLRRLVNESWVPFEKQCAFAVEDLERLFLACVRDGESARIDDGGYLAAFDLGHDITTAGEFWRALAERVFDDVPRECRPAAETILRRGSLATRIAARLQGRSHGAALREVYEQLCTCLERGEVFGG